MSANKQKPRAFVAQSVIAVREVERLSRWPSTDKVTETALSNAAQRNIHASKVARSKDTSVATPSPVDQVAHECMHMHAVPHAIDLPRAVMTAEACEQTNSWTICWRAGHAQRAR